MQLTAAPSPVMIDPNAGELTGTTIISYAAGPRDGSGPFFFYRQWPGQPWHRVDGVGQTLTGSFPVQMSIGQVVHVRCFTNEVDAKNQDLMHAEFAVADLTVAAVAKQPPSEDLIQDHTITVGGTFIKKKVATAQPAFVRIQASRQPPVRDQAGVVTFPATGVAVVTVSSADVVPPFQEGHILEAQPLDPGHDYFAIIFAADRQGNWQYLVQEFATRPRMVTVGYTSVHIVNDGDVGENSVNISVWLTEGNTVINACELGWRDVSDRPSPGEEEMEDFAISPPCAGPFVLGPKPTLATAPQICLFARGLGRNVVGSHDVASNFLWRDPPPDHPERFPGTELETDRARPACFTCPTGEARERVIGHEWSVRADPQTDNELAFDVSAIISVEYPEVI